MAQPTLDFTVSPTFTASVDIPVPGSKARPIKFTFKGRDKEEFKVFMDGLQGRDDVDIVMDIASGWEISNKPWGEDSLKAMFAWSIGAPFAILQKYISEQTGARLGN